MGAAESKEPAQRTTNNRQRQRPPFSPNATSLRVPGSDLRRSLRLTQREMVLIRRSRETPLMRNRLQPCVLQAKRYVGPLLSVLLVAIPAFAACCHDLSRALPQCGHFLQGAARHHHRNSVICPSRLWIAKCINTLRCNG